MFEDCGCRAEFEAGRGLSRRLLGHPSRFQRKHMLDTEVQNVGRQSAAAPDTTSILYNKRLIPVTSERQRGSDPECHRSIGQTGSLYVSG